MSWQGCTYAGLCREVDLQSVTYHHRHPRRLHLSQSSIFTFPRAKRYEPPPAPPPPPPPVEVSDVSQMRFTIAYRCRHHLNSRSMRGLWLLTHRKISYLRLLSLHRHHPRRLWKLATISEVHCTIDVPPAPPTTQIS